MAGTARVTPGDCIVPLQHLRDTLNNTATALPSEKLRLILEHRHEQLRAPWKLSRDTPGSSASALSGKTISTSDNVVLNVDDSTRELAKTLLSTVDISSTEAYIVAAGYEAYSSAGVANKNSKGKAAAREEGLLSWYAEETLALPEIVLRLSELAYDEEVEKEWKTLGVDAQEAYWHDADACIQGLFRGWAGLATRNLGQAQRSEHALFWAIHQLKLQSRILDVLFNTLYRHPLRSATTSVGLIKAVVQSGFGTQQANTDVWEEDAQCRDLQLRIRDLLVLIVVDSLCLSTVLERGLIAGTNREEEPANDPTVLASKDQLFALHLFLGPASDALERGELTSAFPPVLAAWAAILRATPDDRRPPNAGYEGDLWQVMLTRALQSGSGLMFWLRQIVSGPLFADVNDTDATIFHRKIIKDVLIALSELAPSSHLVHRSELYAIWSMLFAGGGPTTSLKLASDFWVADSHIPQRSVVITTSEFPLDPVSLPRLLAALSGMSSPKAKVNEVAGVSPIRYSFEYLSRPLTLTVPIPPRYTRVIGEENGQSRVEAALDIVLPGFSSIRRGKQGRVVRTENERSVVVWDEPASGGPVLIEIMRVAVGLRGYDEVTATDNERLYLSVADLGIQQETSAVLAAGMGLISVMIKPQSGLADALFASIRTSPDLDPIVVILNLAFATLAHCANAETITPDDTVAATSAFEILSSLTLLHPAYIFPALRADQFFDLPTKRPGTACRLARRDASGDTHDLVLALLRFVKQLCQTSIQSSTTDDGVVRAAIHHVFTDIWQLCGGWRYRGLSQQQEIAVAACGVFQAAAERASSATEHLAASNAVADIFIRSASYATYRPLIEWMIPQRRRGGSLLGYNEGEASRQAAAALLAALLRLGAKLKISASKLPGGIFASVVPISGGKIPLIEAILRIASDTTTPEDSASALVYLVQAYLDNTALSTERPSLVAHISEAVETFDNVTALAQNPNSQTQRLAAWKLLNTIMATQPGAHVYCIGNRGTMAKPLEAALREVKQWQEYHSESAELLSAILAFLGSVLASPAIQTFISTLHPDEALWKAVHDISTRPVPTPPTFTLSKDSADFAARITEYAHAVQARANATGLLASEMDLLAEEDDDGPEPPARKFAIALYRNAGKLVDQAESAMRSSCDPDLHISEVGRLGEMQVELDLWRTSKTIRERRYGIKYLYDGEPQMPSVLYQSAVNFSLDMLNLNWSQLDADIAYTKAWHRFAESVTRWTEGDGLAGKAALRSAVETARIIADEDRPGDVMAAVQMERLWVVATLLETGLDTSVDVDDKAVDELTAIVRRIVESTTLLPTLALRNTAVPAVHRPLLRILYLVLEVLQARAHFGTATETFIEIAGVFIVDAADHIFDLVSRNNDAAADLVLAIAPLIELVRTNTSVWLNRLCESNLIARSLELIKRIHIVQRKVPTYIPSVLLFHLALASHPRAAEKLAVSGVLASYQDNTVATEAEYGRIEPSVEDFSVFGAWYGMLLVVKSLLAVLPDTASFARSDVIPFIRLTTAQIQHALYWDAGSPIVLSALQETHLVTEMLYSLSRPLGDEAVRLLEDFGGPLVSLLSAVTEGLTHPRTFASLVLPATEDEQVQLIQEREVVEKQEQADLVLVKMDKTPVFGSRVYLLVQVAQTAVLALVGMSGAWGVMKGQRQLEENLIIEPEHEVTSTSTDPIGIIGDLQTLVTRLSEKLDVATPTEVAFLRTCYQFSETASLLACAQLVVRKALFPEDDASNMNMMIDSKSRRSSLSRRPRALLEDLEEEWRQIVSGPSAIGDRKFIRWLEEGLGPGVNGDGE